MGKIGTQLSQSYVLSGGALTPAKCTIPNMSLYMRRAREESGIKGVCLGPVEPAATRVSVRVGNHVDPSKVIDYVATLSSVLDPEGKHGQLRITSG